MSETATPGLPQWVRSIAVAGMALVFLAAVAFGALALVNATKRAQSPATVVPTVTPRPSATATRTATPKASPTPFATPSPVPPRSHQVQPGETLSEIAADYDVAVSEILALNPDVDPELLQVGQVLLVPPDAAGYVVGPGSISGDPDATRADFVVHVVRPGEALLSIAAEYGVSVQAIRQANDLGAYEDTINVNQSLIIPLAPPSPTPTPMANPDATATPRPPYGAPPLLSPADGEAIQASSEPLVLQWASVGILEGDEWYMATLEQPAGGVISATHYTRTTFWRVPEQLLADLPAGRQELVWRVQVVKEHGPSQGQMLYRSAGAAGEARRFFWLPSVASPSPSPTAES